MPFFTKKIQYLGHILSSKGMKPLPLQTSNSEHASTYNAKTSMHLSFTYRVLQEIHKNFAKIAKLLTLLTHQQAKVVWTPIHHNAFFTLKESIIQVPILHYQNPKKCYIVYTDASSDACGAQLSQEYDGTEFPIAFLSHTFTGTQCKWSTTEQEAYGVYYAVTK